MKKSILFIAAIGLLVACQKANNEDAITLSASSTSVTPGETVTVTATTSTANTLRWSVNPAANANGVYTVTTEKTNYYTFAAPGTYTIGVRARNLKLDSTYKCNPLDSLRHHVPDSIWNHRIGEMWQQHGHDKGGCKNGQDLASVVVTVK
jgi:hypothetical protein